MPDTDPEQYSFEVAPVTDRDLMRQGPDAHKLVIGYPVFGDGPRNSFASFAFTRSDLIDLHETVGRYLEESDA